MAKGTLYCWESENGITLHCVACTAWVRVRTPIVGLVLRCWLCGLRYTLSTPDEPYRKTRFSARIGGGTIEVDAQEIFIALQQRHPVSEWVYLPQVRTRTGTSKTLGADMDSERYLDAFAMHCWESKGYTRVGYEIKVSRSDWLRELEDPRKRAQGYFLTNQFWYVVAPGVYKPGDEISVSIRGKKWVNALDSCGVLEVQEDGTIKLLRKATWRQAWPMPDTFVASLMRSYVHAKHYREMVGRATAQDGVTEDAEIISVPEQLPLLRA